MGAMKFDPEAYTMSNEEWCKRASKEIKEEKSIREGEASWDKEFDTKDQ